MRTLAAILVTATASLAGAQQTIQGRITERTAGISVAGVVVSALDAAGTTIARTVSDSATGYRMPVLAGMTRLHFRRIGFSPAEVAISAATDDRIDVVLTRLPTQLPPVKAVASAQCPTDANSADALSLWEEARAGLLTSLVARESKTAFISVLVYQTDFDGDDEKPRSVRRHQMADVSHAFSSADPAFVEKKGYFDGAGFLGPDENVLADESFLLTHCFRLGQAPDDSTLALEFSPARGRKVVDIEGTVRLQRDPLDLRAIEYRYTNVATNVARGRPGGSIRFLNMPNGITMVQEWRVRSAWVVSARSLLGATRMAARGRTGADRGTTRTASRDPLLNVSEAGALIELMQWPGAPAFLAPLATISGAALDKATMKPLPDTPVRLYGTPFIAKTDSAGLFSMIDVLPGVYWVDVGDPNLELFGVSGDLVGPLAVKYGRNSDVRVGGESPAMTAIRGCAEKMDGRLDMPAVMKGDNVLFGRIIDGSGLPMPNREFRAEVSLANATAGSAAFPLKGKTDKTGRFRLCGLPASRVRVISDDRNNVAAEETRLESGAGYAVVTLTLERRKSGSL
jgi:hypothetical protein